MDRARRLTTSCLVLAISAGCRAPARRLPQDPADDGPQGGGGGPDGGGGAGGLAGGSGGAADGGEAKDASGDGAGSDTPSEAAPGDVPAGEPLPPPCAAGELTCDGTDVRTCDAGGKLGPLVEACAAAGKVCSGGRCTSTACRDVELGHTVVGCLFYGLDTDNSVHDDAQVFGFPVGNPGTTPAPVKVQKKVSGAWMDEVVATVMPGQVSYLRIASAPEVGKDWHIEGTGVAAKAYRIASDQPIVAYQINADDENGASGSSGSTLLVPAHVLGREYVAITPASRGLTSESFDSGKDFCFLSVVAARDKTKVKVEVTAKTQAGGGVPALAAGGSHETMLDEGDVLQIECAGAGDDLTGSRITADRGVVVYSGITCGGFDPARTYSCDHIEETMYPVSTWGRSFVFLDLRMPAHAPSKSIWGRVIASEDGTDISFDAPMTLAGLPSGTVTLKKGEILKLKIDKTITGATRAHFSMNASKPVEVESFMGTQEGGAVIIPVDQFLDDYLISVHPWFQGYVLITRKAGTPVTLDGTPVLDSVFTPAGAGFEVSYIAMPRCETDVTKCGHRVAGAQIGVTVTANGGVCNYCYAGGAGSKPLVY